LFKWLLSIGFFYRVLVGCSIVGQVPVASVVVETTLDKVKCTVFQVFTRYRDWMFQ